jgi:UDP-N-acetylglucosamine 3-dehydrogenase
MRVGILGTGHMGNTHARQYHKMPDVQVGYHDRNADRGHSFQTQWHAHCCGSFEELAEWADVLDICVPTDLHLEYAQLAIARGKALFLEKPLARTMEEAAQIIEAADKAEVPLMVGQVVRYFPEYRTGHQMVKSGAVGTPAAARTRRGGAQPRGLNDWFLDHERSGGVLLDLAIHDFDWLRWTLGEIKFLYSQSVATRRPGADYALTTLTFESGAVAHVEATWMDPAGFRTTFEVAGSKGLIDFDSRKTPALRTALPGSTKFENVMAPHDDPYYCELRAFIDAVRDGTPPPVSGYDGLMALSISLAALESARTGRVIVPSRG